MVRNRDLHLKHNFMNFLLSITLLAIIIMTSIILYATLMPLLLLQQFCTCDTPNLIFSVRTVSGPGSSYVNISHEELRGSLLTMGVSDWMILVMMK